MSQPDNEFDIFDPTGMLKSMRDQNMETWAKMMTQYVHSDAYADSTAKMLDTWLSSSSPFRKMVEKTMNQALANLSMPSKDDITQLAERLTHIEMRLDDLDAKLDECLRPARSAPSGKKARSSESES